MATFCNYIVYNAWLNTISCGSSIVLEEYISKVATENP
jgi:hypothetical protein